MPCAVWSMHGWPLHPCTFVSSGAVIKSIVSRGLARKVGARRMTDRSGRLADRIFFLAGDLGTTQNERRVKSVTNSSATSNRRSAHKHRQCVTETMSCLGRTWHSSRKSCYVSQSQSLVRPELHRQPQYLHVLGPRRSWPRRT